MTPDINPEPVPYASQLAILPFLAAVEGFCMQRTTSPMRITVHRIMTWEGNAYFQQLCTYFGTLPKDQGKVGRMLPVTAGIIGFAFEQKKIARTKRYESKDTLLRDLAIDMKKNKEEGDPKVTPPSYLAVPFLGPQGEIVLVLYAECAEFNFFSNDATVESINSMCRGFCRLIDWVQEATPLPTIRNFPLQKGAPIKHEPTVYSHLQEALDLVIPSFQTLASFNYETSVS